MPTLRPSRSARSTVPAMPPSDQALHDAIVRRDLKGMRTALGDGANPLARGQDGVPLWFVCTQYRTPGMLKVFLDAGADPNDAFDPGHPGQNGMSLLLATAYQGTADELDQALGQGGDPHRLSVFGDGIVRLAVFNGNLDVLRRAIAAAPTQAIDEVLHRKTALHKAVVSPAATAPAMVDLLLDAGANLNARTEDGTLFDLAREQGQPATLAALERRAMRAATDPATDLPASSTPTVPRARTRL